jgi:ribosomal protein S18 acetylase RimI-like enzyme
MDYRFLSEADMPRMYTAFLESFADYFVQMSMSETQFAEHLANNGVRHDCSVGAFDGEQMVGILLNGIDDWQDILTAYDAGTGVIPAYRGQGIAGHMLEFAMPLLREQGIKQCLLEVIRDNTPAIKVYRRLGFTETRSLECIRLAPEVELPRKRPADLEIEIHTAPYWDELKEFWDWHPAWQNSIESIERNFQNFMALIAVIDELTVGYVILNPNTGGLAQLAVDRYNRRQGVATSLLRACRSVVGPEQPLSMINIDGNAAETLAFFDHCGFERTVGQYEMVLPLV